MTKCCKGKTSSTTPPLSLCLSLSCLPSQAELTHTLGFQTPGHTYMLPIAHYLNLPLHLPLTLSSRPPPFRLITPSPPICHSSPALHLFSPLVSFSLVFPPTGRLSVDVREGSVVSNSPSDTGLLTFRCTLRKEGFLSLLTGVTPHRL